MAVVRTIKIGVEVVRSKDFQSVRVSGEVTLDICEGDNLREEKRKVRRWLGAECRAGAGEELERVLYGGA